jgi:quercetin dioxygenase-like cupin family protein
MKNALTAAVALVTLVSATHASAQLPTSQVVMSNPSALVTLLSFQPGGATGRHSRIEAELGIVLEGELTLESPTGRQTLRAGMAYWLPGLTPHDIRNEGAAPAKVWDILLRRCD